MKGISRCGLLAASVTAAVSPGFSVVETVDAPNRVRRAISETPYWMEASATPGMVIALIEEGKTRDVLTFGAIDVEGKQRG